MSRIVMLLSNAFRPDPRVAREAQSLARSGHRVTVVCWDREGNHKPHETVDGYQIDRIQNVPTAYGAGARQILHTPRFWKAAIQHARKLRPEVIHCHDLDTLPAGWRLKRLARAKLVYDAHEDYPALMSLYLPGFMLPFLSGLESFLLRQVDYTITASTVFADKLRAQRELPITTIGNYQSLAPFESVSEVDVAAARKRLGLEASDYVVAYIGGFSRNRQLLPLIQAASQLPDVHILLWGDGHQRQAVEDAARQAANVRYLGWLPADQVPLHTRLADVIYYCLVPDYPGAIYNAPNTLSNAMAAGRPIVANDVGDLGRIVRQTGCGILVPEVTPPSIRDAIEALRDQAARQKLGRAGRAAAESQYNWAAAEAQLGQVYTELLGESWQSES